MAIATVHLNTGEIDIHNDPDGRLMACIDGPAVHVG